LAWAKQQEQQTGKNATSHMDADVFGFGIAL
jgi:hypothetical protein